MKTIFFVKTLICFVAFTLRALQQIRGVALAVVSACFFIPSAGTCATYNFDLSDWLQPAQIATGYGLYGITQGVESPFLSPAFFSQFAPSISLQAGDTINFGSVALGAFIGGDQYGDIYVQLGALTVSYTPLPSNLIPGTAQLLIECFSANAPDFTCAPFVQEAFDAYVPPVIPLTFTIPAGDTGVQLAFTDPFTYMPSSTPIPAALPLFATGLGAMGLCGWRRRRKNGAIFAADQSPSRSGRPVAP